MSPRLARMTDKSEGEPRDRLGRIAAAMLQAGEQHVEAKVGDKAIIMLDHGEKGMVAHGGYEREDGADAFVNMLAHLTMLAEANGMRLDFVPMTEPPGEG